MTDSSWDNDGGAAPRKRFPTWAKIGLGCGVATLLLFGTCVGGSLYISHKIKQDPEGFKHKIQDVVRKAVKDDWAFLRRTVDQLGTDEGSKTFYAAQPKLHDQYPTEAQFQEAVKIWRPKLEPIPEEIPDLDSHDFTYQKGMTGKWLSYRCANGTKIRIEWASSNSGGPLLTEITVR